ncbi:MAG: DUF1214 domain-containing protein [Chromatiales bacterium]|nr:DUF1214 domain-containing protein [Chromatiales bacterium]
MRNALDRYGILSSMPLKRNADGSLDIYIQAKSPGSRQGIELAAGPAERDVQPDRPHLPAKAGGTGWDLQAAAGQEGTVTSRTATSVWPVSTTGNPRMEVRR